MKKFTAILLTLVLALSLAACGSDTTTASDGEGTTAPATEPQRHHDPGRHQRRHRFGVHRPHPVVYFSATGNTQVAAEYIADLTGGDLFQLEPADPYTDEDLNWTDESSRVVQEHDNPEARDVAWWQTPWTTGTSTTPCFLATPSGGASPPGGGHPSWQPMTSPARR